MKACQDRLEAYLNDILQHVGRSDRRKWGGVYLRGLLLDGHRKSVGAMAERLPDGNEQALHNFVNLSPWDPEVVQQAVAGRVVPEMGPAGMLLLDDIGFSKKGKQWECRGSIQERLGNWETARSASA